MSPPRTVTSSSPTEPMYVHLHEEWQHFNQSSNDLFTSLPTPVLLEKESFSPTSIQQEAEFPPIFLPPGLDVSFLDSPMGTTNVISGGIATKTGTMKTTE